MADVNVPSTVWDLLAAGRLIVRRKSPYFGSMVTALVPYPTDRVPTISVTKELMLPFNPEWIGQRTQDEMGGLIFHEIMHPTLNHHERRGDRDPLLWNFAGDIFINDQARNQGYVLPKGGLFPETFKFPRNLTADEYYALLVQKGKDEAEEEAEKGQGEGDWKSGKCGSGAGNPIDGEPEGGTEGGRSESEVNQTRMRTAEAVKQHAQSKGRGSLPLGLDRWADDVTKPAKVPWQTVLGRFVRQALAFRPGAVDYSYRKISRRQGGVGFGVGCPVLPAYVRPVPRVTFVLDTSGSMSQDQLAQGIAEATQVLQAVGAEITFLSCDYAVHACGRVENPSQLAKLVKGGGGSSFIPAFEHLAKMRPKTELAIFATDGDIAVPTFAPAFRTVWLLIDAYREGTPTLDYGERIVVSTRGGADED